MSETTITLGLPLPLDVFATLCNLVESAYPNSKVKMGYRTADVIINDTERVEDPADLIEAKQFASKFSLDALFEGVSDEGMKLALPEYLAKTFATMFIRLFADNPLAINYLEMLVDSTDDEQQYAVHIARSKGQTPHELAQKYKADLDAATDHLAKIAELVEILDEHNFFVNYLGDDPITTNQVVDTLRKELAK